MAGEHEFKRGASMASDEPIPLYDGEPSGATIIPEGGATTNDHQTPPPRPKRRNPRRPCCSILVCFSPRLASGRVEHVLCPLCNISKGGVEIEYDGEVATGTSASVSYHTASRRCVRVTGTVRHCCEMDNGRFRIGIELNRFLDYEEIKPAKALSGREVAPGVRARKLQPLPTPTSEADESTD